MGNTRGRVIRATTVTAAALAVAALAVAAVPGRAMAATYSVGPTGDYAQFADLPGLRPGDVVEVQGGATYDAHWFQDDGAPGMPIVIRGLRSSDGRRPIIAGGRNTVELAGDHYVLEGFEITGGSARCVFHHAHDIVIRDCVIHDCPQQGLLGADTDSGSLLLEHTEIYATGAGDRSHQIYMSTDQLAHPGSVFRMQFCWIHDGNGGNGVKSRAERNEIYYNWIEESFYHELELIGPDPGGTPVDEDAFREDSDVVGNVFVKGGMNPDHWVVRFGGDGTGQSNGRYRFVYNTVLLASGTAGVFRLFDGIESLEAHNNVIFVTGSGRPQIVRDTEAAWVGGARRVAGSNNWVVEESGVRDLPGEWTGTLRGADPGFESIAASDLRPMMGSVLVDAAHPSPTAVAGFDFPRPETSPRFHPPARTITAVGGAVARPMVGERLDIGAYEHGSGPPVMTPDAGPPVSDAGPPPGADAGPPCVPSCDGRSCGDDGCSGSCGSCAAPLECNATGECACVAPREECAGECVDSRSDPRHCGGCAMACASDEVCSGGACSGMCAAGLSPCDRACVDVQSDRSHCGACARECGDEQRCTMGTCEELVRDAGPRDGGSSGDGGARADAGRIDAGAGGSDDGGCGCVVAGSPGGAPTPVVVCAGALAWWVVSRRRAFSGRRNRRNK